MWSRCAFSLILMRGGISRFLCVGLSHWREVGHQYGLYLHFSNGYGAWVLFHKSASHLHLSFWQIPAHVLHPFLNGVVSLLFEYLKLSVNLGCYSTICCISCKESFFFFSHLLDLQTIFLQTPHYYSGVIHYHLYLSHSNSFMRSSCFHYCLQSIISWLPN